MRFECNFGTLNSATAGSNRREGERFRIALLGDFSGRAMAGTVETGEDLARRKPIRVDVDNLDEVIERLGIRIQVPLDDQAQAVEIEIESMDDFHPDELYDKLEVFEELASLRQRLGNDRSFAAAAKEVRAWAGEAGTRTRRKKKRPSRASTVPVGGKLSDFARLSGRPSAESRLPGDVQELIKHLVSPYVVAAADPDRERLVAAVDESLSAAMRGILHQSEFQTLEAVWRGVDLLVRRLETNSSLQLVLYDVSAEEIAADLSSHDDLEGSGLYKLLVEQPASDAAQGSLAAILGLYTFDQTPPHAELLGRIAKIAAATAAPFVASIHKHCLDRQKDEPHPLVAEAWSTLRNLPEAKYLALTVPQFLLRLPYGKKSDPVDAFAFEEFTPRCGVSGMLWGNGALLVGLMLGQTYSQQGLKKMQIGSVMSFGEMPYHYYTDADGDQIALPCTDRLLTQQMALWAGAAGFIPVLSIRGQDVVRLGSTRSIAGVELAGVWPESAAAAKLQAEDRQQAAQRLSTLRSTVKPQMAGDDEFRDDLAWKMKDGTFEDDDDQNDDDDLSSLSDDGDDDLSSLLEDASDTEAEEPEADRNDDDLETLLASMSDDEQSDAASGDEAAEAGDDDELDSELAALLADL